MILNMSFCRPLSVETYLTVFLSGTSKGMDSLKLPFWKGPKMEHLWNCFLPAVVLLKELLFFS